MHPLYSIRFSRLSPSPDLRKNVSYLMGRWGNEIKKAAEDPKAMVVMLVPEYWENEKLWFYPMIEKMVSFSRRRLGDRFFLGGTDLNPRKLREELIRRKIAVHDAILGGKSFGEWWNACVHIETDLLARTFALPSARFSPVPELSLEFPVHNEQEALGSIRSNVRYRAMRLRRKQNRVLQRKAAKGRAA